MIKKRTWEWTREGGKEGRRLQLGGGRDSRELLVGGMPAGVY